MTRKTKTRGSASRQRRRTTALRLAERRLPALKGQGNDKAVAATEREIAALRDRVK